jgi:hypothetical protein
MLTLSTPFALEAAITSGAAVTLSSSLDNSKAPGLALYRYCATVDSWILQSAAGTAATAGAGSCFVPAGDVVLLDGAFGATLSAIADSTSGKASVTPVVAF